MGGKRTGTGKYIFLCTAFLTCLFIASCASVDSPLIGKLQEVQPWDEPRQHLIRAQKLLVKGDYETALEENEKALSLSAKNPPGDEALYNIALVYAYPGNPKRDYVKSSATLRRLIKEYPQSPWTDQAKTWAQVMQESENAKRAVAAVQQENDKLKRIIDESRKVDMEIEEKKRENVR